MMRHPRLVVAALSLSAAAFAALIGSEGFTDRPVIPTEGDRPTIGFGSTFREDGSPVRTDDPPITPPRAVNRSLLHIQQDESRLRECVRMPLTQVEYDVLVDFSYQYGSDVACRSSMVRFVNQGMYREACESYLLYRFAAGYDCSTRINGQPNRRCWGVWTRSQERRERCVAVQ